MSTLQKFKEKNESLVYEYYLQHALLEKIFEIMKKKRIKQSDLAKRLKVSKSQVFRLLAERNMNVKTLARIFMTLKIMQTVCTFYCYFCAIYESKGED